MSIHLKISKYLSVVLVVLILADIAGFALWNGARAVCYHYVRNHRQSIAMRDTISMSAVNYQSGRDFIIHKADEIEYHGQMFDIKRQIVKGDKILLIGHYDKFENKLFKLLHKLLDGNNKDRSNTSKNILLRLDCVMPSQLIYIRLFGIVQHYYQCVNDPYNKQQYIIPITAPPEMAVI